MLPEPHPQSMRRTARSHSRLSSILRCVATALLLAACGGGGSNGDGGGGSIPCDAQPNYAGSVDLLFWPDSGAVPLVVDFGGAPQAYSAACFDGFVGAWNGATGIHLVDGPYSGSSPLTMRWVSTLGESVAGITSVQFNATTGAINAASIEISASVALRLADSGRACGTLVHEIGHALGIQGHSPDGRDLMSSENTPQRSQVPTAADANTMRAAYCGFSLGEQAERLEGEPGSVAAADARLARLQSLDDGDDREISGPDEQGLYTIRFIQRAD